MTEKDHAKIEADPQNKENEKGTEKTTKQIVYEFYECDYIFYDPLIKQPEVEFIKILSESNDDQLNPAKRRFRYDNHLDPEESSRCIGHCLSLWCLCWWLTDQQWP